jgi:hypothetical protein
LLVRSWIGSESKDRLIFVVVFNVAHPSSHASSAHASSAPLVPRRRIPTFPPPAANGARKALPEAAFLGGSGSNGSTPGYFSPSQDAPYSPSQELAGLAAGPDPAEPSPDDAPYDPTETGWLRFCFKVNSVYASSK